MSQSRQHHWRHPNCISHNNNSNDDDDDIRHTRLDNTSQQCRWGKWRKWGINKLYFYMLRMYAKYWIVEPTIKMPMTTATTTTKTMMVVAAKRICISKIDYWVLTLNKHTHTDTHEPNCKQQIFYCCWRARLWPMWNVKDFCPQNRKKWPNECIARDIASRRCRSKQTERQN